MNTTSAPPRLGNILVERGYISVEQLQFALEEQRKGTGKLLGEILTEKGFCNDDQVIECLATCLAPGELPRHPPVVAGPHLMRKYHRAVT